jgi:AcrR family transcriptional regulator
MTAPTTPDPTTGRTVRRGRPPEISREQILDAAWRQLERDNDPAALNVRALATKLGVTAMALYRYVESKDQLLELLLDRLLTESGLPPDPRRGSWQKYLRDVSLRLFDLITTAPVAAQVFSTRPVVTPAGLRRMEACLRVIRAAGFSKESALDIYSEIHTYTIGFATIAASRARHRPTGKDSATASWTRFFRSLPAADYPLVVDLAPDLAAFTSRAQFERGLDRLIAGIAATTKPQRRST